MKDFKLKLILSALGGVIFSFVFILLTFALPVKKEKTTYLKAPKGKLEIISHSLKK
ncbi:MAG: hypothetical protein U9O86_06115 [Campylobacterota bacterium]|nr:hypothetical protein [Campylobacterota bacterium]